MINVIYSFCFKNFRRFEMQNAKFNHIIRYFAATVAVEGGLEWLAAYYVYVILHELMHANAVWGTAW